MRIPSAVAALALVLASTITLQAMPLPHECTHGDFAKRFWCEHNLARG